jgi:Tetratricopeptide repeat
VLGSDHPDVLCTRSDLAIYLTRTGHLDEALSHARTLVNDEIRLLGPGHPYTLSTQNVLAQIERMVLARAPAATRRP